MITANIVSFTPKSTQSYDIHFHLGGISFTIGFEWLVFIVGAITAVVAIRSFHAVRKQNELSTVPHLTLRQGGTVGNFTLRLLNHNSKLAFDIKFDRILTINSGPVQIQTVDLKIRPNSNKEVDFLGNDDEFTIEVFIDGKNYDRDFSIYMLTNLIYFKRGYVIRFRDSQNIPYFTRLTFDPKNRVSRVLRPPTRLTFFRKLDIWIEEHIVDRLDLIYYIAKLRIKLIFQQGGR